VCFPWFTSLIAARILQCVAVCCSVLQCVAVCCSVVALQREMHYVLQRDVIHCRMFFTVLQCVAVCCSVSCIMQCSVTSLIAACISMCCSVLQSKLHYVL